MNASSAKNSAVTSTTVDAVASDQPTPCSVTARAPNTNPPTWENGRQLAEASRTIRPQMNTHSRRASRRGAIASHARPRIANSPNCQPSTSANPPQPTDSTPASTRPAPNQPTSSVPSNRPRNARATESFFTSVTDPSFVDVGAGLRLYTIPTGSRYTTLT